MNVQHIVVNTILFVEQLEQGASQLDFFEGLHNLGVRYVEVRQEYFRDEDELSRTAREASKYDIKLLLSVPKTLFRNGSLDVEMVQQTLRDASILQAKSIKWTRGDFQGWTEEGIQFLTKVGQEFPGLLTVENDQTTQDGTVHPLLKFLSQCRDKGVPLYTTFDVGNWLWVGEDPLVNADLLSSFVRYIHLKDGITKPEGPVAKPLGEGELPLSEVLKLLPKDTLVALEYPGGSQPLAVIQTGIGWLVV